MHCEQNVELVNVQTGSKQELLPCFNALIARQEDNIMVNWAQSQTGLFIRSI